MGFNTVVVLLNDQTERWPADVRQSMQAWCPKPDRWDREGHFGYGQVLSVAHADHVQVVAVHRNTGALLGPTRAASEADLAALADILRGHGYTVKRPGRSRGEGPYSWGYAAKSEDA